MIKLFKKLLVSVMIVCLSIVAPVSSWAQDVNPATEFRMERDAWNKDIREGRVIVDEMNANKGNDAILEKYGWEELQFRASRAEEWIKRQDEFNFREILKSIEETQQDLETRANHIQKLRDQIFKEQARDILEWEELIVDDSIQEYLQNALGAAILGEVGSRTLKWFGKYISAKVVNFAGKATGAVSTVAGKVLGPVSTAYSIYQVFEAADEYAGMRQIYGQLLERAEMIAYFNVLLKKYDEQIAAQDIIISDLYKAYDAYSKNACR